jgi:hypothetical protein
MSSVRRIFSFSVFALLGLFPVALFPAAVESEDGDARASAVFDAYERSYPDILRATDAVDGEPGILVNGLPYIWARGRILPLAERDDWNKYRPYVFYDYPRVARNPADFTADRIAMLKAAGDPKTQVSIPDFQGDLLTAIAGGHTRGGIEKRITKTLFLARTVSVNSRILGPLARVQEAIMSASATDPAVAAFVGGIGSIDGYNWRDISGTSRRSYHGLGLALDILPQHQRNLVTYWAWERARNADWMLVPLKSRWSPPDTVVAAFEREGFIWGGKWDFYDTMHFEYRPELIALRDGAPHQ